VPKFGISGQLSRKGALMVGLLIPHGQSDADLIRGLTWTPLSAVYSSPLDRAVATAHPLANDHGLDIHVRPALRDANGETRQDAQRRVVEEILMLARTHQGETIAIVTHDDLIRGLLAEFDGLQLDEMDGVEISPSRVCAIGITPSGICRVLGVNISATDVAV
jgi:probable phosphoglycerate mutase